MDEPERLEMQDPASWEFVANEKYERPRKARAVVSVAFSRDDFEDVERYAMRHRMRVSEFIRGAALDRLHAAERASSIGSVSAGGTADVTAYFGIVPSTTRAGASELIIVA
jgi:hypothetical protein